MSFFKLVKVYKSLDYNLQFINLKIQQYTNKLKNFGIE